ncbi:MAG: exonuclease domain-containing protein [Bacteroidota bacterium]|nr:exonuclease domain-containing protein [Bacteroidota bacterium]
MLYAIVDIETTGGFAAANGITEIAVFISDGKQVIDSFHTLLNPYYTIPRFVESLTGITNEMVEFERDFKSIADELFELLSNKVFVAHNVNFDYSFVKHHLAQTGHELDCKKLCTIRLGRQVIPGLKGYGLDKICKHLEIEIDNRHRAKGDAEATVKLFHYLLQRDTNGHAQTMLGGNSKEQFLPPNISSAEIKELPSTPGVYYFLDKKGKVIYVGKAKNLSRRVNTHFSNNKTNKQKQEFLKKIYHVTHKETATELMAFILESIEIKKLWPEQNRSQKRFEQTYALYSFEDIKGYFRLCIEKKKKTIKPLFTFNQLTEAFTFLRKLMHKFELCPKLCFLQSENISCQSLLENKCKGGCEQEESAENYNERVRQCIQHLDHELPTFALVDDGFQANEQSCILIEKGRFYGMGYLSTDIDVQQIDDLKYRLTPYAENEYIRGMVFQYAERFPNKKVLFNN